MGRLLQAPAVMLLCALATATVAQPRASAIGALRAIEGKITLWSVPTQQMPRDPAAHPDGGIYFAVAGADRIARFDPSSAKFREWPVMRGSRPHGIAIAANGHVFFAGHGDGTLGELDPVKGVIQRYTIGDASSQPYSLAIDAGGNVWCTHRAGRITRFEPATGRVTAYAVDGIPYGLAFDANGLVWVTRIEADRVSSLEPSSGRMRDVLLGAGSKPRRIARAPDGQIWISLYGAGKVAVVDPVTHAVTKEYAAPG